MKYMFVNTAGAFAQDYKVYGFEKHGNSWDECNVRPEDLLIREVPFSLKYTAETLHLGNRGRSFSIWIAKSINERKSVCVISLKGISSATRRDFTGRIIFDSVAFVTSFSGDAVLDHSSLTESQSIAMGLAQTASDSSTTFDDFANMEDFEKDLFPFSDIDSLYNELISFHSNAGLNKTNSLQLGVYDYLGKLLNNLGIPFKAMPLKRKGRVEVCADANGAESPNNTFYDANTYLKEALVSKVENAALLVEDGLTEIIGEERTSRFFTPFKSFSALLSNVKNSIPFPGQKLSRSPDFASSVSVPSQIDCEHTLISCSCGVDIKSLEKIIIGLFSAANESSSVALGLLVGNEGMIEIVEGIGTPPSSLVLISIPA